jgi:hypothetical protein
MILSQMAFALWCLRWAAENPDSFCSEYGVEGAGELTCAVSDQELD